MSALQRQHLSQFLQGLGESFGLEERDDVVDGIKTLVSDLVIAYENAVNSENMARLIKLWAPNKVVTIRVLELPEIAQYAGTVRRPSIIGLSSMDISRATDAVQAKRAVEIAIDFYNGEDEKDSIVSARQAETGLIPLVQAYRKSLENLKSKGWARSTFHIIGIQFLFQEQRDQAGAKCNAMSKATFGLNRMELRQKLINAFIAESKSEPFQIAVHVRDCRYTDQGYAFQCTDRVMIYAKARKLDSHY